LLLLVAGQSSKSPNQKKAIDVAKSESEQGIKRQVH